jgi:hypothetical protein
MSLSISRDLERQITEQARAAGYPSADAFLRALLLGAASPVAASHVSDAEFIHLLDELTSEDDLPVLPADFSRADIYLDHD